MKLHAIVKYPVRTIKGNYRVVIDGLREREDEG